MTTNSNTRSILRAMRNPVPSSMLQIFYGLPGGFRVHSAYWGLVRGHIRDILPFLSHDKEYTAEQLLGSKLWSALNSAEARMAKLCVDDMVKKHAVSLKVVGCDSNGPVTYQLA